MTAGPGDTDVHPLELRHDDPVLGELVFDGLACGPADGELVLLLHGFPQSAETWRPVMARLGAAGFRVVAPDQRGYSRRARPAAVEAYRLADLVGDVVAIGDELGAGRFHLVGHDWGGVVAWAVAAWHPDRLSSVTSVSTPHPAAFARSLVGSTQPLRSAYVGLFALPAVAETVLGLGGHAVLRAGLRRTGLPASAADRYTGAISEPGALTAALGWYRALVRGALTRSLPDVGPVAVPSLFVWGRHDTALGPAAAAATERFVTGPYRFVPLDASHWIPETEPERLSALLLEHLTAPASRRPEERTG